MISRLSLQEVKTSKVSIEGINDVLHGMLLYFAQAMIKPGGNCQFIGFTVSDAISVAGSCLELGATHRAASALLQL